MRELIVLSTFVSFDENIIQRKFRLITIFIII